MNARKARPGGGTLDARIPSEILDDLKRRGHTAITISPYEGLKMMAVRIDPEKGVISGGVASNPTTAYAAAW